MIPRRIYDQPISNFPSTIWWREMADQEHENDPTPAWVVSSEKVAADPAPALAQRAWRDAGTDPDLVGDFAEAAE